MSHSVLIRSSAGNSIVRCKSVEQVSRAVARREAHGEVIHKVGCHVSCPCNGEWEA